MREWERKGERERKREIEKQTEKERERESERYIKEKKRAHSLSAASKRHGRLLLSLNSR